MGELLPMAAMEAYAAVVAAVAHWPGLTLEEGPTEASVQLRFRRQVLGHVYAACGDHAAVDAIFPASLGEALIALGRGDRHPVVADPGWVLKPIHHRDDIAGAVALLRDNYDRLAHRLRLVSSN